MTTPSTTTAMWLPSAEPAQFGGYVAWEAAHRPKAPEGYTWFLPIFVGLRSVAGGPKDLVSAIRAALALGALAMARDEHDALVAEAATAGPGWPHEVRLVAHIADADLPKLPSCYEVLHVGAPVLVARAGAVARPVNAAAALPLPDPQRATEPRSQPMVAVIDDGIAFLNARFRADPKHTRCAAVWLQAPEVLDPAGVLCGRVVTADEIDMLLADGEAEADVYRRFNRDLLPRIERQSTNHRISHGTHVMDTAAGAAPEGASDAEMRGLPIFAVQLPPAVVRDTSGRRLEGYVVQGLRWLMAQALRRAAGAPVAPLIINLSLGSLAGPGNDSAFLADWFRHETERYARLAPGAVLRIVAAYGNARRARLVARAELRAARDLSLDWRILPDDHTPSFVELRTETQRAGALRLTLEPPDTALEPLDIGWPEPGECWAIGNPVLAMVTGVAENGQRMVHVAVAPTAGATVLAPPGRWRIGIASNDEAPALISIRVQRDDTPAGYRILGRQSWLDHPHAWDWDDETRDWTAPQTTDAAGCPLTREGTSVAYAGTSAAGVYFVGAVRPETGKPGAWRAALYSASGVETLRPSGESIGPTLAALGDDGRVLMGRRASGVLSGSNARLSGTSVAAPAVARALALYHARATGPATAEAELKSLLGAAPKGPQSPLIGHGVLAQAGPLMLVS